MKKPICPFNCEETELEETTEKRVLDPCCGSRMMWFDRAHGLEEVPSIEVPAELHIKLVSANGQAS